MWSELDWSLHTYDYLKRPALETSAANAWASGGIADEEESCVVGPIQPPCRHSIHPEEPLSETPASSQVYSFACNPQFGLMDPPSSSFQDVSS